MDEYAIDLKTDKDLGSEIFVRNLIHSWYKNDEEQMRPERFNYFEPVRHVFADEGMEAAIQMWLKCGSLMFKRVSNPKFEASVDWRREKGKDPRKFPWDCTVWLKKKAGDKLARIFFDFLIEHFDPAYEMVTTYKHRADNHFIKFRESPQSTCTYYEGLDIWTPFPRHDMRQQHTLPGIYWLTYFSNRIIDKIGRDKFALLPSDKIIPYRNGLGIKAYEKCFDIKTEAEEEIKSILGKELFWDKKKYIEENHLNIVD